MRCEAVEPELMGYHFGTLDEEVRADVEAHLVECRGCIRAFVELKRAVEAPLDEAPSPLARARIRRSVEQVLRARPRRWERPFAFGVASAAVVLTATLVHLFWIQPGHAPIGLDRPSVERQAR